MEVLITIMLLSLPLIVLYDMYDPSIDVVAQSKGHIVLLWYNEYEDGYYTGKRTYKKLF